MATILGLHIRRRGPKTASKILISNTGNALKINATSFILSTFTNTSGYIPPVVTPTNQLLASATSKLKINSIDILRIL